MKAVYMTAVKTKAGRFICEAAGLLFVRSRLLDYRNSGVDRIVFGLANTMGAAIGGC